MPEWYETCVFVNEYGISTCVHETDQAARDAADQAAADLAADMDIGSWAVYLLTHKCADLQDCFCHQWVGRGYQIHPDVQPYKAS